MTWRKFSEKQPKDCAILILVRRRALFGHDYYVGLIYGNKLEVDNVDGKGVDRLIVKETDEWQEVEDDLEEI